MKKTVIIDGALNLATEKRGLNSLKETKNYILKALL